MSGRVSSASALLEAAAREQAVETRRLDDELLLLGHGDRSVLCHGFVVTASRVAQALCDNDAWLRAHLARRGLPVVDTRLVAADDARFGQWAAEALGYPVRMRPAEGPDRDAQLAARGDSFGPAWRAVTGGLGDRRGQVILERAVAGEPVAVAVIGAEAIVDPSAGNEVAKSATLLSLRVVDTLPGVSCASVHIARESDGMVVDRVDPAFLSWIGTASATAVAKRILAHALTASTFP